MYTHPWWENGHGEHALQNHRRKVRYDTITLDTHRVIYTYICTKLFYAFHCFTVIMIIPTHRTITKWKPIPNNHIFCRHFKAQNLCKHLWYQNSQSLTLVTIKQHMFCNMSSVPLFIIKITFIFLSYRYIFITKTVTLILTCGTRLTWMLQKFSDPTVNWNCLNASTNGIPSMSPMVPPSW